LSSEAYVIIKQNENMRKFRNAGATEAGKARTLAELKVRNDRIFRKMVEKDVFRPGRTPETYYMEPGAADDFIQARRRRAFYMLILVVIVAALMFFLSRR